MTDLVQSQALGFCNRRWLNMSASCLQVHTMANPYGEIRANFDQVQALSLAILLLGCLL